MGGTRSSGSAGGGVGGVPTGALSAEAGGQPFTLAGGTPGSAPEFDENANYQDIAFEYARDGIVYRSEIPALDAEDAVRQLKDPYVAQHFAGAVRRDILDEEANALEQSGLQNGQVRIVTGQRTPGWVREDLREQRGRRR